MKRQFSIVIAVASLAACTPKSSGSLPKVSEVGHTHVKEQGTDNCWLYAASAWVESHHLAATGRPIDLSESYWTYWYLFDLIKKQTVPSTVSPEGSFSAFAPLVAQYGYLLEEEFVTTTRGVVHPDVQEHVVNTVNKELVDGVLATIEARTDANIMKHLDAAFGINMSELRKRAKSAALLLTGTHEGVNVSLQDLLTDPTHAWSDVSFPGVSEATVNVEFVREKQKNLLTRVMKALNDHKPVLLNFTSVKSAIDRTTSTYKGSLLAAGPTPITGGGHSVMVVDYAVDNVPLFGSIEEGEANAEQKAAALNGTLRHLKVKNSWGPSEEDLGSKGFYRMDYEYLTQSYRYRKPSGKIELTNLIRSVILPPGY